jgi:hypothetical protein
MRHTIGTLIHQFSNLALFTSPAEKRQRTVTAMRQVAAALDVYLNTWASLPGADTITELGRILTQHLSLTLPTRDGWGHELHYQRQVTALSHGQVRCSYWIGSSGGASGFGGFLKYMTGAGRDGHDFIYSDGHFLSLPGSGKGEST